MPGKSIVSEELDLAFQLQEEKEKLFERRDANRDLLRKLVLTGRASQEEAEQIEELYPPRKSGEAEAE